MYIDSDPIQALAYSGPKIEKVLETELPQVFFTADNLPEHIIDKAVRASILVTKDGGKANGSAVFATREGKTYLITAGHVLFDMYPGEEYKRIQEGINFHYQSPDGKIVTSRFNPQSIVYRPKYNGNNNYPYGDLAVLAWEKECCSVPISQRSASELSSSLLMSMGFPGSLKEHWENSKKPLITFGKSRSVFNESMKDPRFISTMNTTILADGGNSGGGVFEGDNLVGILSMGALGYGSDIVLLPEIMSILSHSTL